MSPARLPLNAHRGHSERKGFVRAITVIEDDTVARTVEQPLFAFYGQVEHVLCVVAQMADHSNCFFPRSLEVFSVVICNHKCLTFDAVWPLMTYDFILVN